MPTVEQIGFKSTARCNEVLDDELGSGGTIYLACFTAPPSAAGGGTEVSTSGTAYARLSVTNNTSNWPDAASGLKSNGNTFTWATPTADWGTVVGIGSFDASTGGNLIRYFQLTVPVLVRNGVPLEVPAGGMVAAEL
jgi:hypothetical protein